VKKENGPRSPAHERYLMARHLSRIEASASASASTKSSGSSVRVVSSQDELAYIEFQVCPYEQANGGMMTKMLKAGFRCGPRNPAN
jgi:hypothetical protein